MHRILLSIRKTPAEGHTISTIIMKVTGQPLLSPSPLQHRLILFVLLWTTTGMMRLVMGMPRPNMQLVHRDNSRHAPAYLYPAKTTPTEPSFSPQPQYITLTPPMTQIESQHEIALDAISRLSAAESQSSSGVVQVVGPYSATAVGDSASKGSGSGSRHERDDSIEDWEAWKQQFNRQVKERSCRLAGSKCAAASMRRR